MRKLDKKFLLSIKEFGKLTNIHPKALRYYDSIGVLKPIWVDPESGYRYYSFYQREEAYLVKVALECGMQLKDLLRYISFQEKIISYHTFIPDAVNQMEQQIQKLQNQVQNLKYLQEYMFHTHRLLASPVPALAPFPEYHVFRIPYEGVQFTDQWLTSTQELSKLLNQYDIISFSIGLMQVLEDGAYHSYLYASFLGSPESNNVEPAVYCPPAIQQHPYYSYIPAGEYLCAAVPESGLEQAWEWSAGLVPERPEMIIEHEMGTMDYHYFPPRLEQRILLRRDDT